MRGSRVGWLIGLAMAMLLWPPATISAQTPQPFPRPPSRPAPPTPEPPAPAPQPAPPAPVAQPTALDAPTEAELGVPIYPTAHFLRSFDAGRGQRYYLFGSNIGFGDLVIYYRTVLKQRGNLVFDAPATHTFEVGRFREESMAFPPSVTIKDYTWNGSEGYLHVRPGTTEAVRYTTIIQIVPSPPDSR